ncbi:MAG: DUF4410 domain-containing protein [Desulfuromonadales bacterium]|nr:DUF4410 domain-containing protein [Desulfuromonadales bacterium]
MKRIILMIVVMMLAGCASTLPPKVSIDQDYNTMGVKTASVRMDCTAVKSEDVDVASIPDFCQMILSAAKSSIRKKSGYKIEDDYADLEINIKLEEVYGGNAAARFWIGLGAGKSAIVTLVDISRSGRVMAEGRLIETSTLPNVINNAWGNESLILQDAGIIGGRIADFVANPRDFDFKPDQPKY